MSELTKLPNIGKVLEENLKAAGINTAEELREIGTKEAFTRVRMVDNEACIRMLYGLHGAVIGKRDTLLDDETKEDLKKFFRTL